jgi:hypothetical protein
MVTSTSLKDHLEAKIQTIERLTNGISDEAASQEPADGEWCVKEVLSHLAGSEMRSFYDGIKLFLDEDTPQYDLTPGESFYDLRQDASVDELRQSVLGQYRQIAETVGGLTDVQLERTAHMPSFKETPLGEYPTLGLWVGAIVNFHLPAHIEQLEGLCK